MNTQQFLTEFGHIATAPEGVAKLRELVLLLAISGRLTQRVQGDVPASSLIRLNRRQQQLLIKKGKLKPQPDPTEVSERDQPWELPNGWNWTRLGYVTNYGDAPKVEFEDVREDTWILELEDIERTTSKLLAKVLVGSRQFKSTKNRFPAGAVLYGKLRPYLDKVLVADSPGVCSTEITPISFFKHIEAGYLRWYLKSPYFIAYANGSTHGINLPRLRTNAAREALFPFPPATEQSQIVAKVDELMVLCDRLEGQQGDQRKLQNKLRQAILQTLANTQNAKELQTSWQRLEANFGMLFSEPQDVRSLKGVILDLAVSGRLLAPFRAEVAAPELLKQIAASRSEWAQAAEGQDKKVAAAMLKKLQTQQVAAPDDVIPEHWRWASLLQVSQAIVDCHNKTAPYVSEGVHLVRTTDIRDGHMDLTKTRKIAEDTYANWARRMPPRAGDIFFTREAPMGEAAIVPEGERVCLGQRTMLIRLFPKLFCNRYLLYVIQSPSFQKRMDDAAIGMGVKHLRVGAVENLVVPVPSRVEQDEIVRITDSLLELCERYADHLKRGLQIAANLAQSAVEAFTGIEFDKAEETTLKAPQTELVALLRMGTIPVVGDKAPLATILSRHNGEMRAQDLWQRWGVEKGIDAFYAQLKAEIERRWIDDPSYVLDEDAAASSKKYPDGAQVAKMIIKQDA